MKHEPTRKFLAGLLMLPAALFVVAVGPKIGAYEGDMFPVVKDYVITEKIPTSNGEFDVVVAFEKVRGCSFMDQNWSIEIAENVYQEFQQVFPEDGIDRPRTRPLGKWRQRWHIKAPVALIDKPMRLIVYHKCWGPLAWETETRAIDQHEVSEIIITK
jgi:hypothetical protein